MMMNGLRVTLALCLAIVTTLRADDAFYRVPLTRLKLTEGALPQTDGSRATDWKRADQLRPYVALDGPGEAYFTIEGAGERGGWRGHLAIDGEVVARAPEGNPITGAAFVPNAEQTQLVRIRFEIASDQAAPEHREVFLRGKAVYYSVLLAEAIPGAAYFRLQADRAWKELGEETLRPPRIRGRQQPNSLAETYRLFSGGRAVSENLQLDRELPLDQQADAEAVAAEDLVRVDALPGITVPAFDWNAKLGEAKPDLDPLAAAIPADQHAIFLPSYKALETLLTEVTQRGLPIFRASFDRSEDARLVDRYERQLGLQRDAISRVLGPKVIRSIAVTGSDPYFPTGTDVAVLFQAANPDSLHQLLAEQINARAQAAAAPWDERELEGISFRGGANADRSFSSYLAQLGDAVVVTNSLAQMARLIGAHQGGESIASLAEYRYFRARYPLASPDETGFLFLSDATIRRWCGPQWRIGASRRLRAAAIMADVNARYMKQLVPGLSEAVPIEPEIPMRTMGTVTIGPGGVASSVYGSWTFITPIAELPMDEVTKAEAQAYRQWRDTYQRNWSWAFDPIALSFQVQETRVAADLSVVPLILHSRYNTWLSFTQGVTLAPGAGDPHDAIGQVVVAVNRDSPAVLQASTLARMAAPEIDIDPLGWLGKYVTVYADPGPFWDDLLKTDDPQRFWGEEMHRLPLALHADAAGALKLTAFVTAVRSFIEQTAPGMTAWETRTHNDQPYVKVGLSEKAKAEGRAAREEDAPRDSFDQIAVYYAATPRALIVSLNEDVLRRALERLAASGKEAASKPPWLGSSMALRFTGTLADVIQHANRNEMQYQAWSNIPILNEWRRMFPDRDPVEVHEQIWRTRLIDPAGESYVWNQEFQTMTSTLYGHPGEPKLPDQPLGPMRSLQSGDFGLTFEERSLRAKAVLELRPLK